jgi:hypothetical protein
VDDEDAQALRDEGLNPDDPAVPAAIDLVQWELSLGIKPPHPPDGSPCTVSPGHCEGKGVYISTGGNQAAGITETEMAAKIAVAAALIAAASVRAPLANADTPDQQFLNTVHSNGVGGDDGLLITYAHEYCDIPPPGNYPSFPALRAQGVVGYQAYLVIQTAASRAYCPTRIPTVVPPQRPPLFTGL